MCCPKSESVAPKDRFALGATKTDSGESEFINKRRLLSPAMKRNVLLKICRAREKELRNKLVRERVSTGARRWRCANLQSELSRDREELSLSRDGAKVC